MTARARLIKAFYIKQPTENEPFLTLVVKALVPLKEIQKPTLKQLQVKNENRENGVLEFELVADEQDGPVGETEVEINWVIDGKSLPTWVKAIKVNGTENFNIEIIK